MKLDDMRIMGSRAHGMVDYPMGALLMSAPLLFKLDTREIATWIPVAIGASMTAVSAMTDYEAGVSRKIPFKTHLMIDAISGVALAISPFLFRSRNRQWIPHVIFGLSELLTAVMTRPTLDRRPSRSASRAATQDGHGTNGAAPRRTSRARKARAPRAATA